MICISPSQTAARSALISAANTHRAKRRTRTGDGLFESVGAKLPDAEIKDAPSSQAGYEEHDVQFLEIATDRGVFTMSRHNEHDGYYRGFDICAIVG